MSLYSKFKIHTARIITSIVQPHMWYKAAYTVSGIMAYVYKPKKNNYVNTVALSHADKLNGLLAVMTRKGKPFPIPVRTEGIELFLKPRPNGLILCSTHIPLSKVAMRCLMEQGFKPTVAVAGDPSLPDSIAVWGSIEKIPAINTGPFVLQKAKTVLQQGGTVVALVDHHLGDPYSPNIFRLAEKLYSDIIFFDAALQTDGTIIARFWESKWNGLYCENRVYRQMNELYQYTSALLEHYDNSCYINAPLEEEKLTKPNFAIQ